MEIAPLARRALGALFVAALCFVLLAIPTQVFAQSSDDEAAPPDPTILSYSESQKVPYEEAERRLQLQTEMGVLSAKLEEVETTYAGSWIEHEPDFRFVIALATPDAEKIGSGYLEGVAWANEVRIVVADKTLVELREELHRANETLLAMNLADGLVTGLGLDIPTGKVRILTADESALTAELTAKSFYDKAVIAEGDLEFQYKAETAAPAEYKYPYLLGGTPLDQCTVGYVVYRLSDGRRYVTTAGHCPDDEYVSYFAPGSKDVYLGLVLTQNDPYTTTPQPLGKATDIQIHNTTVRDFDLTNIVRTDVATTQRVVNSVPKSGTPLYTYVCKYGRMSDYSCGYVWDLDFAPEPGWPETYVWVWHAVHTFGELACLGDSGGPVFISQSGVAYAIGILTHAQDRSDCNGQSNSFFYTPVDWITAFGFGIVTSHYPEYYYQNVYWSETSCIEYKSQLDENGNITTQTQQACSTSAPGSGTIQSYTAYVSLDAVHESIWRGGLGYVRDVPLTSSGTVNWGGAPGWWQCCSGTAPEAQGDYIVGNTLYQNVFYPGGTCTEFKTPLRKNGTRDTSLQTSGPCRTYAPGSGTIQSYTAYVTGAYLHEAIYRGGMGYLRDTPLNAPKTDVDWFSAPPFWTYCCSVNPPPRAQNTFILNHP